VLFERYILLVFITKGAMALMRENGDINTTAGTEGIMTELVFKRSLGDLGLLVGFAADG
jgi:hypothetical protein